MHAAQTKCLCIDCCCFYVATPRRYCLNLSSKLYEESGWITTMNFHWTNHQSSSHGTNTTNHPFKLLSGNESNERVNSVNLLLKIISTITSNETAISLFESFIKRLHFLVQLNRWHHHFYETVIRYVLEYSCPAWHNSLTADQQTRIESVQRQTLTIIYGQSSQYIYIYYTNSVPNSPALEINRSFL